MKRTTFGNFEKVFWIAVLIYMTTGGTLFGIFQWVDHLSLTENILLGVFIGIGGGLFSLIGLMSLEYYLSPGDGKGFE